MQSLNQRVWQEVLNSHLAGDDGLHEETQVGEHGKSPVLDLLNLQNTKTHLSAEQENISSFVPSTIDGMPSTNTLGVHCRCYLQLGKGLGVLSEIQGVE